jgi:hypothetical protein
MPMVARARERVLVPVLTDQIRSEFEEMPCLRLTLPQASRFWNVDSETCRAVLEQLVEDGFLVLGRFGYMRPQSS